MESINSKCSKYGSAYSQLDNKPDEDTTLQTALGNAADTILENNTIITFYNTNKTCGGKKIIKKVLKTFGALGIPILLFLETLDDYEWVCVFGKSNCGSKEDYTHLTIWKLLVSIIFTLCTVCLHIEGLLE